MKSRQSGVSRIELIVVVIILVVVTGAAMPKKLSLPSVATAATAAMTVNYAGCSTKNHKATDKICVRVTSCSQAAQLMRGGLPTGHTVDGDTRRANGDELKCRVLSPDGASAPFDGIVAGLSESG